MRFVTWVTTADVDHFLAHAESLLSESFERTTGRMAS
jgi:hypothetical protein